MSEEEQPLKLAFSMSSWPIAEEEQMQEILFYSEY